MSKKYESNPVPTPGVDAAYLLSDENARERADVTLKLHRAGEAVEIQTRRHALLTGAVEMDAVLLADRLDLVERSTPGAATAREVATAVAAGETWSLDQWVDALRDVSDATSALPADERAVLRPVVDLCRRDAVNLVHSAQILRLLEDAAARRDDGR